jgi:redox-sensitive bicupin YhaK (pirin superfamily)
MKPIEHIAARPADLGDGLTVHRALPNRQRRMVGAWCFLDHAGPVDFPAGRGLHVGAHPHIGLQTFTWLIEGEVMHRDSLGNEQIIRPGQVNLMTSGRGIVHTEDSLTAGRRLHAAQLWIALPEADVACSGFRAPAESSLLGRGGRAPHAAGRALRAACRAGNNPLPAARHGLA